MNSMSEIVVTYVTNCLWMTCVVAAAATLISRALRRTPSCHRHALWVVALSLAVLLPFMTLRHSRQNDEARLESGATTSTLPAGTGVKSTSWAVWQRMHHRNAPVFLGPLGIELGSLLYIGFVFYRGARLYRGWYSLQAVFHYSKKLQITPRMRTLVEQCHSRLGMKLVPIVLSVNGKGPATVGVRHPVLIVPDWLLSEASEDELCSVLGHELAHVRRHDFLLNLVYEIFLLPISFHPAAALIKARIDQTRELACDEIAVECLSTPAEYAHSILSIAKSMAANQSRATVAYALGLFDTNTLEDRIMTVLAKANRIGKRWSRASALSASALLTGACLGISGFSIQVNQSLKLDADLQPFVGTWEAKFKGKTFQTIKLEKNHGSLSGTVSHADISVDPKSGELTDVSVRDGNDAIVEATLKNGILLITEADDIQFEMKVTATDEAQLQIVIPPEVADQVPAAKPWKLVRVNSSQ